MTSIIVIILVLFGIYNYILKDRLNPVLNKEVTTGHPDPWNCNRFWGFRDPSYAESTFSHYIDPYGQRTNHKYPFYGYSLYGFDDNYYFPKMNYLFKNNPPAFKYPPQTDFKHITEPLRSCDGSQYDSSFYVKRGFYT